MRYCGDLVFTITFKTLNYWWHYLEQLDLNLDRCVKRNPKALSLLVRISEPEFRSSNGQLMVEYFSAQWIMSISHWAAYLWCTSQRVLFLSSTLQPKSLSRFGTLLAQKSLAIEFYISFYLVHSNLDENSEIHKKICYKGMT